MIEILRARKEALQERGVKGFTLMEMLIVIAIIAVLIAIAIPVLGAQLENAQEATDAANIRSAYAEVATSALQDPKTTVTSEVNISQGDKNTWSNPSLADAEIGGLKVTTIDVKDKTSIEVKYDKDTQKITINGVEAKTSSLTNS